MKTLKYILYTLIVAMTFTACDEEWDNHYKQQNAEVNSNEVEIVNATVKQYMNSGSYVKMNTLFENAGVYESMNNQNLLYTVFVVKDEYMPDTDVNLKFIANAHITTASVSPSNMADGQRIVMWNDKYVTISKMIDSENESQISLNGSKVVKVIKVNNGYIYELDNIIPTPKSLLEVLQSLNDEYSVFKEMVLSKNKETFDKEASTPIGVDESGNTVYDSVIIVTNPYFLAKKIDLSSESGNYTMLIPSNELIEKALSEAKSKIKSWNVERHDSIFENWCFQSAFFREKYTPDYFIDDVNIDLTSAFGCQWRTSVNKVDTENPITMSNGIAYYITSLKIPQNVLIWRYKDYFKWYPNLTASDKDKYFNLTNLVFSKINTEVSAWTPGGGWPAIDNTAAWFVLEDANQLDATLDYTAFRMNLRPNGSYTVSEYLLPPGEYSFHFGVGQASKMKSKLDISINGELLRSLAVSEISSYSRDRFGGGGPEFYNMSDTKYDRDGGQIGIFTITGEQAVPVRLTFRAYDHDGSTTSYMHHWCIRPTINCY